jgi:U-box domain
MPSPSASSSDDAASNPSPPDHFLCPISLEVMQYPVYDRRTGHVFERRAILEWMFIYGNGTNPLTRRPMGVSDLARNFQLQFEITEWKKKHHPALVVESNNDDDCSTESELELEDQGCQNGSIDCFFEDQERISRLHGIRQRVLDRRNQQISLVTAKRLFCQAESKQY